MSRNDYLEALAAEDSNPFMETALPQTSPFMETVALDIGTDVAKIAHRSDSEVLPLIETVRAENQRLHIGLGNCASEKELLKQNWWKFDRNLKQSAPIGRKLRRNSRPLKQNFAPTATILSQLRAKRKKSPVSLADIKAILEIIEES